MVFIGDVHGKIGRYRDLVGECERSVQVGDMGVGFVDCDIPVLGRHRFIRGNHDNPALCREHPAWIPDGTIEGDTMFIGGALSIDRAYRTEGIDWWLDEELSSRQLSALVDVYTAAKPRVMVTHECPEEVAEIIVALAGRCKLDFPSRTRQAFQAMFEAHRPELWIFGHWHQSLDVVIDGTRFVCLGELEARVLAPFDRSGLQAGETANAGSTSGEGAVRSAATEAPDRKAPETGDVSR